MSEELGRRALERAESMRNRRATEVLRRAVLLVRERSGAAWESSEGHVVAVDVRALLDGTAMGLVRSFPAVHDAVVEAISAAAPEVLGASVVELTFEWGLRERGGDEGYRDHAPARADRRSATDVQRALAAFLAASGDDATARDVERARVVIGDHVEVVGVDRARIAAALAALVE